MDKIRELRERLLKVRIELELVRSLIDNTTSQTYIDRCCDIQREIEEFASDLDSMEINLMSEMNLNGG
jgi:hypothetical protein